MNVLEIKKSKTTGQILALPNAVNVEGLILDQNHRCQKEGNRSKIRGFL